MASNEKSLMNSLPGSEKGIHSKLELKQNKNSLFVQKAKE